MYLTHFVAAIVAGAVLYMMNRERFRRFAKIFLAFSLAGYRRTWCTRRSRRGSRASRVRCRTRHEPCTRSGTISGSSSWRRCSPATRGTPNPVGALPSEHGAYPLLFLLLFWAFATRGWRIVLVLYTLVMAFALVYLAEHYVTDIVLGWIYAALAFVVVSRILDRREARRDRPLLTAQPVVSRA